jgi:hypothetical protein
LDRGVGNRETKKTRRLHLQASVKDSEFIYDKDYNAIISLTTEIHRDMPDTTAF